MTELVEVGISLATELRMGNEDCWELYRAFENELFTLRSNWRRESKVEQEVAVFLVELVPILSSLVRSEETTDWKKGQGAAQKTLDVLANSLDASYESFQALLDKASRTRGEDYSQVDPVRMTSAVSRQCQDVEKRLSEIRSLIIPLAKTWSLRKKIPVEEVVGNFGLPNV